MPTFSIQNRDFYISQSLNELTKKQLSALISFQSEGISVLEYKLKAFWILLLNKQNTKNNRWLAWFIIKNYWISPLIYQLSVGFFCKTKTIINDDDILDLVQYHTKKLLDASNLLLKNPLSTIYYKPYPFVFIPFFGTSEMFGGMTFRQFRFAEKHFSAYLKSKNTEDLDRLILEVYIPKYSILSFSMANVAMNKSEKMVFLRYYVDCRSILISRNNELFKNDKTTENPLDFTQKSEKDSFAALLMSLSEDITKLEKIDNMGVWDVLGYANNLIEKSKNTEKQ